MSLRFRQRDATAWGALALWLAALALIPGVLLFSPTGLAGAPPAEGVRWQVFLRLALNSVYTSLLATILATAWAIIPALVVARVERGRARLLFILLSTLPLLISPSVYAVAAGQLFGPTGFLVDPVYTVRAWLGDNVSWIGDAPSTYRTGIIYTLTGTGFVLSWAFYPVAFLACTAALLRSDLAAEDYARLDMPPLAALLRVALPLAFPGIFAGAILIFLLAMNEFGIPEALRTQPVLVSEIYVQFGVFYDGRSAAIVAMLLAGLSLALVALCAGLLARRLDVAALLEFPESPPTLPLSRGRVRFFRITGWFMGVLPVAALAAVLVLSTMRATEGFMAVLGTVWGIYHPELLFSVRLAGGGALIATAIGLLFGVLLARMKSPLLARLLLLTGFLLPGPITGMALKMSMILPPGSLPWALDDRLADLDDGLMPLLAAYTIRFMPLVALLVEFALRRVPEELIHATRLESSGLLAGLFTWGFRAALPALVLGWVACFALILGEVGATVLLIPPGPATLSVTLMTLMHYAPQTQVSAICLLLLLPPALLSLAIIAAAMILPVGKRKVSWQS